MAYPATSEGVKQFLGYLITKGLVNANTGASMKTACEKIFSVLDEDEKQNLSALDTDATIRRFMNLRPGVLSPDSAAVYKSRVQKALDLLEKFNRDPSGFKLDSGSKSRTTDTQQNGNKAKKTTPEKLLQQPKTQIQQDSDTLAKRSSVSLNFPLGEDFIAQFVLPKDLTVREAKRLAAYLEVLAVDFEPS
jgi:ribosomal protein S20